VLERHKLEHPNISYTGEAAQALKPLKVWDPDAKTYTNKEVGGMTTEQKPIFDAITAHLFDETRSHQTKKQFVVTARSGRGKTWLMRLIVAKARSEGKVALCVASTALAALNYDGGRTAHSQFKIPVSDEGHEKNKEVVCALDTESSQADFLRAVDIIIWDEALNSHCVDIEAVDTMLRDLMGSSEPFGNKLVIFTGASLRHGMCGYIV
jgi:late competence protein required for DNA uptake (superfamily II DNA/RNA helicase)